MQSDPRHDSKPPEIRVLAFTCSRHRPLMLRHCIMQMQRQTCPVDHAIYVNSPEAFHPDQTTYQYAGLLDDLVTEAWPGTKIEYGPSLTYHRNYLAAIRLVEIDAYDLFLKIDDDDIYKDRYAEDVVRDFAAHGWDYSGAPSFGYLNGPQWRTKQVLHDLLLAPEDHEMGVPRVMPGTTAFSRRAIQAVRDVKDNGDFEDRQWRRHLAAIPGMKLAARDDRNYVYNVHGANFSTAAALER